MNINGVPIHYDSQSTIFISRNPMFHECTKHMDMKLYFIKDIIQNGKIHVVKISTAQNLADMLMKVVHLSKYKMYLKLFKVGKG